MNGKMSPTVKLESQWTLPPIMKAAGLEDCRKISVMSRAGMGPEEGAERDDGEMCEGRVRRGSRDDRLGGDTFLKAE